MYWLFPLTHLWGSMMGQVSRESTAIFPEDSEVLAAHMTGLEKVHFNFMLTLHVLRNACPIESS